MFAPLSLRKQRPLARGSRRLIYQHPLDRDALIKILKSEARRKPDSSLASWIRFRRTNEMVRVPLREMSEDIRVRSAMAEATPPFARILGLVETDLGMGLVVEKIVGSNGRLAPSLRKLVLSHGFSEELERHILTLRDRVLASGIVAGDINTDNVVVATDSKGADRLVIVDGIGDKTFLPLNSMIPVINRFSIRRQFAGVIARLKAMDPVRS